MSECGTWPIGWPGVVNIETTRPSNGNCGRLGIPKRASYWSTSESVKGWTACAPKLRKDSSLPRGPLRACPFRCVLGPLSVSPPRAIARIGHVRLSKRGSVLVLCKFFDQVHNPSSYLGVADPHERFNERQPVACCHEICQRIGRRRLAGEDVTRRRALEEEWDRRLQGMANLLQSARADPVSALLVFLHLLEGDAERIAQPRLTHVQHHTAHTHATANMLVYRIGRFSTSHRLLSQESEHRSNHLTAR